MYVTTRHLVSPRAILVGLAATVLSISCAEGPRSPTAASALAADPVASAQRPEAARESHSPASARLALLLTKTCDAIDHCTVITSSSGPVPIGSHVNYFGPLLETRTTSRIVITTPNGDTATGHCSVSYTTLEGICVLTSGTGSLTGLHANLKVSADFEVDPAGVFTWEGTYHFER